MVMPAAREAPVSARPGLPLSPELDAPVMLPESDSPVANAASRAAGTLTVVVAGPLVRVSVTEPPTCAALMEGSGVLDGVLGVVELGVVELGAVDDALDDALPDAVLDDALPDAVLDADAVLGTADDEFDGVLDDVFDDVLDGADVGGVTEPVRVSVGVPPPGACVGTFSLRGGDVPVDAVGDADGCCVLGDADGPVGVGVA